MSIDVLVVWKEKEGQLVNTYRDELGQIRVLDLSTLDQQQGRLVTGEEDLLSSLKKLNGARLYVPVDLARTILGWDV